MSIRARLNIQGLARKEKKFMSCIIADPGHTFVSIDLAAGEPTVLAHYSGDKNYHDLTFGMVGKEPYYNSAGMLMLDDIYLAGASVSPIGKDAVRRVFEQGVDGKSFAEVWREDKERIQKGALKKERAFHKIMILALGYGQRPKGMTLNARDNGYLLSLKDAKAFYHAYWNIMFPGIRDLNEALQAMVKRDKVLVNDFGFRMTPERDSLALNYFIQSSVSGIIKVFEEKLFSAAPYARYVTTIHDESLYLVRDEDLDRFREAVEAATDSLNEDLGWSVAIRTGWQPGKTLYDAK